MKEERKLFRAIVQSVLDTKSERDRDLFVSRFFVDKPVKMAVLAAKYNLSISRIAQINDKIFSEIRSKFNLEGSKIALLAAPKPHSPSIHTFQSMLSI